MTHKAISYGFILLGLVCLLLAVGFFLQWSAVTALWLWQDSRLSYIFLASILAAIGVPVIWIGVSGEFAAAQGGAIDLAVTFGGAALYLMILYSQRGESQLLLAWLAFSALFWVTVAIYLWSRRIPPRDPRPLPHLVRYSFILFVAVLFGVGALLIFRFPTVFPWSLNPDSSVLFGLTFWGAATYFLFAVLNPKWVFAVGPLAGFLAYDLVLIVPFLMHFATVKPEHLTSLVLYVAVLVYSGALAIYYLFINPATRGLVKAGDTKPVPS